MIKVGIVGAGAIAQSHSAAILNNPDCELVSVCDTVPERAEGIAGIHKAKVYSDYKEMCTEELDAVIINLPHFLHCEAATYFLNNKVNVLVEKPMAMNVAECDKMIAAANVNGVRLGIGHVQQYTPAHDKVRDIIESGKFGRLCRITEVRNIPYFKNRPAWFLDKKTAGGGIVMNYCAHTLDKIFYTTGLEVEEVSSVISNFLTDDSIEEGAQVLLRLTGGVSAGITYCGANTPYIYETMFYFTEGAVKIVNGGELWISEDGKFVKQPQADSNMFDRQICELVKFLGGRESKIATPEYGRKIVGIIEKILDTECYRPLL